MLLYLRRQRQSGSSQTALSQSLDVVVSGEKKPPDWMGRRVDANRLQLQSWRFGFREPLLFTMCLWAYGLNQPPPSYI
ncbi:hypothetical protein TNCV_3910781 [Trichonephila clavipes]|nr:hypothetical protein TNCV_3910781 [Trichonephila clavipes]